MRKLLIFALFVLSMAGGFAASFASFPTPAQTPAEALQAAFLVPG
jgi:hypothetical protein